METRNYDVIDQIHQTRSHHRSDAMRRYMTIDEFRKRFRVVDPHEAAAQEPNKYYDSFIERE